MLRNLKKPKLALALCASALGAAFAASPVARGTAPPLDDRRLFTAAELAAIERHSPLPPLGPDPTEGAAASPAGATFGRALFFDARFSENGAVSCASCHRPQRSFTDGLRVARALGLGTRHTPTLIDAAYQPWFFWDGRADSMWAQALGPLENPHEFGGDRLHVLHALAGDPAMRAAYERLFGALPPLDDIARFPPHGYPGKDGSAGARAWAAMSSEDRGAANLAFANLGKAIEAYERQLIDGDAPFDRYVAALRAGDVRGERALSPAAKRGLALFTGAANCELCHSGPTFSDGQFHNIGLPILPGERPDRGRADGIALVKADPFNALGTFARGADEQDRERLQFLPPAASQLGAFKTPGLRDVARIGPYMHDGRFATLRDVLAFYARIHAQQSGPFVGTREGTLLLIPPLSAQQQSDLVAFLETLDGAPLPRELTRAPQEP